MSKILAHAEFVEADITFNETKEYHYMSSTWLHLTKQQWSGWLLAVFE